MKCEHFCNYHCCTSDCPHIQCDACDEYWGNGIAEDIGLERIKCSECQYYDKRCTCEDCYFKGSEECPEYGGSEHDDTAQKADHEGTV